MSEEKYEEGLANLLALGKLLEEAEETRKRQIEAFRKACTEPGMQLLRASNAAYFPTTGRALPPWEQTMGEA